jgi:glucokinase
LALTTLNDLFLRFFYLGAMLLKIAYRPVLQPSTILAGDIGATKANLALFYWSGDHLDIKREASFKSKAYPGIHHLLQAFLKEDDQPAGVCLGVAGPVEDGKANLTNLGWTLDSKSITSQLQGLPVTLVNDLEAAANSLAVLEEKDVHTLHRGVMGNGNAAILAPGTGLGEAGLYHGKEGYYPFATEGGHSPFSPQNEIDVELYNYLKRKFGHVSFERVVSGPGICTLYDFLLQKKERDEPAWLKEKLLAHDRAIVISENATECAICRETMDLFFRYLATEAASLVLKVKATAGLFLAGGILPHLLPILDKDLFHKWFCNAGRLKFLLQDVPVKIILNEKAPLLGAAYYGIHCPEEIRNG